MKLRTLGQFFPDIETEGIVAISDVGKEDSGLRVFEVSGEELRMEQPEFRGPEIGMEPGPAPGVTVPELEIIGQAEPADNDIQVIRPTVADNGGPDATEAGLRSMLGLDDPESFLAQHGKKVAIGAGVAGAVLVLYLIVRK